MGNANEDFASVINEHGLENGSNTPDFLLARFLEMCIRAWDRATNDRDNWYLGHVMGSENYDAAQARVRELEAEVERLREDATLGADLRRVLESGFEVEVNRGEWSICIERWSPFRTLAETAAVVREWQAGEGFAVCVSCRDRATCAVAREGTRPADGHAERPCPHYRPVEPAPFPEDAARPAHIVGRVTRPVWEAEPADGMEPAPSPEDEARYCPWCGSPVPGGLVTLDDLGATSCERCGSAVPEGGGPLCEECVDKPAPSPEDAARDRIAAAGAKLNEGVTVGNGMAWWHVTAADGETYSFAEAFTTNPPTKHYDRAADFAEAHDSGTDKNTKAL